MSNAVQLKGTLRLNQFNNGQYDEAARLMQSVVGTCERLLGPGDPNTADMVSSLGNIYTRQRDFARAEQRLRQALNMREKISGANDPATIKIVVDLASDVRATKQAEEF